MPETTVLMAVGDDERHIAEAVSSILQQTYRDFEFLIIDDASKDGTIGIIRGFADPRIRILSNRERIGLTASLNAGLQSAAGRLIARMDGDDISYPTRLEKQVSYLKGNPGCGLVGTGYRTIDEHGQPLNEGRIFPPGQDLKRALQEGNQFAHASVMFTREAVSATGGYRNCFRYAQDYDLFLRISEKFAIALIPEILLDRRLRLDSASVRYKVLQDRFAQAAKECARQRREGGSDPAAAGDRQKTGQAALAVLAQAPSDRESRSLAAAGYFSWAMYFRNNRRGYAHRSGYVLKLLKRSLLADPVEFLAQAGGRIARLTGRIIAGRRKKPHE